VATSAAPDPPTSTIRTTYRRSARVGSAGQRGGNARLAPAGKHGRSQRDYGPAGLAGRLRSGPDADRESRWGRCCGQPSSTRACSTGLSRASACRCRRAQPRPGPASAASGNVRPGGDLAQTPISVRYTRRPGTDTRRARHGRQPALVSPGAGRRTAACCPARMPGPPRACRGWRAASSRLRPRRRTAPSSGRAAPAHRPTAPGTPPGR
jgi:hypothetical protein